MATTVLTDTLSEPLNGATTATVDINSGTGNLTIDTRTGGEPVLASGTLQYAENQGLPIRSVGLDTGQATLTLRARGTGRPWFRLPWMACTGATEWQIHLNPAVSSDITAHSDGGNVSLDLAGMAVTRLAADTGGGNMDVVLPDSAANLRVAARSGGGSVTVAIGRGTTGNNTVEAGSGAGSVLGNGLDGDHPAQQAVAQLGRIGSDDVGSEARLHARQDESDRLGVLLGAEIA